MRAVIPPYSIPKWSSVERDYMNKLSKKLESLKTLAKAIASPESPTEKEMTALVQCAKDLGLSPRDIGVLKDELEQGRWLNG
jgi:hypothetical protein